MSTMYFTLLCFCAINISLMSTPKDPNLARNSALYYRQPSTAVATLNSFLDSSTNTAHEVDSIAAITASEASKPAYYGLLAHLVAEVIDEAVNDNTVRPQAWRRDTYTKFDRSVVARLHEGVHKTLQDTSLQPTVAVLERAKADRSNLFSLEHNTTLRSSLLNGSFTAVDTISSYMKEMHAVSKRIGLDEGQALIAMENSTSLTVAHASINAWMLTTLSSPSHRDSAKGNLYYDDDQGIFRRLKPLSDTPLNTREVSTYNRLARSNLIAKDAKLEDLIEGPAAAGCPVLYSGKVPEWKLGHSGKSGLQLLQTYMVQQASKRGLLRF
jgi:hypothetical protein